MPRRDDRCQQRGLTAPAAFRTIAVPVALPAVVASIPSPPRAARCLAVIPARNEAASVAAVVAGVRATLACDVLVVDDASSDATAECAAAAGASVLRLPLGLGAWGATQTGIRYALRHGYEGVIALDADGQHLPDTLPALFRAQAETGAHVVIGTCVARLSRAKRLAWRYLRLLTGLRLMDLTSGLRLYDAQAMMVLAGPEASLLDYQDIGVLMLLVRNRLRISETPVAMRERCNGHSRVFASWLVVARYMVHTTVLCIAQLDAGRRGHRSRHGATAAC
ncbi:MAG: glycosyltransferase family 2 protein [Dokdonella sp.]|nr:MAG: glycosyltransferase family 2 protein [Dokdonella sp.]MCC6596180.1 glycosyltransferase family 2 protein [Rhodanobacteraceae bacterium]